MLIVLSPAKTLDYHSPIPEVAATRPEFGSDARQLIDRLRGLSPAELARLMDLSDSLAELNVARYAAFKAAPRAPDIRPAVLAFDGDVYEGLAARALDTAGLDYAQAHLRILSGLYGVLRPLDAMQAHRLEMGTRLSTDRGRTLYAFWGDQPTEALNRALRAAGGGPLVNLASEEYFKVVHPDRLKAPVIQPVFKDRKGAAWKVISFNAKRARGLMTRWAIDHRIKDAAALKDFDREGWRFEPAESDTQTWVFRREQATD